MDPVIHFELPAQDKERAGAFYERAFAWQVESLGPEMGNFVLAFTTESDETTRIPKQRGAINGGFYMKTEPNQATRLTILVDDLKEAIKRIEAAGGTILGEPVETPGVGLFATFKDTEGNLAQINQDFAVARLPDD
jgi:predicted enzyme related to lactoylglutathione lyase